MLRRILVISSVLLAGLAFWAQPGLPSNKVTTNARNVELSVVDGNTAVLSYARGGQHWSVTAVGAINARFPSRRVPQAGFRLSYRRSAGSERDRGCTPNSIQLPWLLAPCTGSRNGSHNSRCNPYDGSHLSWVLAACKGTNGDYWVAQAWPRNAPNYGVRPKTQAEAEWDLRLSHWRGALPQFTVKLDWAYRRYDHLYGSVTYRGRPMYGFGTTRGGNPTDRYGILLYLDTLDAAYGPGWKRENSFVTHKGSGIFCYGLFPHASFPSGKGTAYRATLVGPGVLPDLSWEARAPGPYDAGQDARANAEQRVRFSDRLCRPN